MAPGGGQAELCDLPCSGHPATAVTPTMLQCADVIILKDQHISPELLISNGDVNAIIQALRYSKVSAR
jgi:hypothetical protein